MPNVTRRPGNTDKVTNAVSRALVSEVLQMEVAEEESIIRNTLRGDSELSQIIKYLEEMSLPEDLAQARHRLRKNIL